MWIVHARMLVLAVFILMYMLIYELNPSMNCTVGGEMGVLPGRDYSFIHSSQLT